VIGDRQVFPLLLGLGGRWVLVAFWIVFSPLTVLGETDTLEVERGWF
jgi:hypothetical protein